ncbi:hypothetical protein [Actinomadura sp. B10D3]|uniref:hypothetical protein n=1 Tax=Actinomadura sp. B10D3 TaxID=3153557 RepID=UPI00325DB101
MRPELRAVGEGALVMAGTLVLLMLGVVVVGVLPADAVLGSGFFWTATVVGGVVLLLGAAVAGGLAVRRLSGAAWVRSALALAGPVGVVALLAVPTWAGGERAAGSLYLGATLCGGVAGVLISPRLGAARGR